MELGSSATANVATNKIAANPKKVKRSEKLSASGTVKEWLFLNFPPLSSEEN